MTKSIEYEPFLTDYDVVFHGIFTLIDPAMNTSEIKPVHLAVPRTSQGLRRAPPTEPNVNSVSGEAGQSKAPSRLLANRYLNQKRKESTSPDEPAAPANDDKKGQTKAVRESSRPAAARAPAATRDTPPADPCAALVALMTGDKEFYLSPLAPAVCVRMLFVVDSLDGKTRFQCMPDDGSDTVILTAVMNGASRADGFQIMIERDPIGEAKFASRSGSMHTGIDSPSGRNEAAAVIYNSSFMSAPDVRMFEFLVPALKRIAGKNQMLPIPFGTISGLVTRHMQGLKEAIKLRTRQPTKNGSVWDTKFEGKLQHDDPYNFILYHESNQGKDICVCGARGNGMYGLEIRYPLSPLQGFIAAISSAMPV